VNGDHLFTNADLQALLNLLKSGGGSTSVPEPSALVLTALGITSVLVIGKVSRRRIVTVIGQAAMTTACAYLMYTQSITLNQSGVWSNDADGL
jgi:hypothetical protein